MAIVAGQIIPPSLEAQMAKLARASQPKNKPYKFVGMAKPARHRDPEAQQRSLAALASSTGVWFKENWPSYHNTPRIGLIQTQLLSRLFDDRFWMEAEQVQDLTYWGSPEVLPWSGTNRAYHMDEFHKATISKWGFPSRSYPTRLINGTIEEPSPGWFGEIDNLEFKDRWMAQRVLKFTLPLSVEERKPRPVIIQLDGYSRANASYRGFDKWFIVSTKKYFSDPSIPINEGYFKLIGYYDRHDWKPFVLADENQNGWTQEVSINRLFSGRSKAEYAIAGTCSELYVQVVRPSSMGFNMARNESILVKGGESVRVFVAISEND